MQNDPSAEAPASIPPPAEPPSPPAEAAPSLAPVREIGGPPGPEPTRYGDWEKQGRCIDF